MNTPTNSRRFSDDILRELAAWNARQQITRAAYEDARRRADCQLPHSPSGWCVCRARRRS
jgi:hypothetical protein